MLGLLFLPVRGGSSLDFFSLYQDNRRVLRVWAKKRKKNNQRSAGFFRYLFEKSESKNHWVPVISNTSKNREVS
jgi:hypothetical protein